MCDGLRDSTAPDRQLAIIGNGVCVRQATAALAWIINTWAVREQSTESDLDRNPQTVFGWPPFHYCGVSRDPGRAVHNRTFPVSDS
jgi:hypothetical protein